MAEESYHPLLPKLAHGTQNIVANFKEYGEWSARDLNSLKELSESMETPQFASQINSIPDIWARPLLFEMALFDGKHLLHKRAVAEWRGLLALLAFKDYKKFNLEIREVTPPKRQGKAPFFDTLAKMAPKGNTLSKDTFWLDQEKSFYPYVILYKGQPIGMLSPTTLVCTATECLNRLNDIVWSDGKFLKDPAGNVRETDGETLREINDQEKKMLADWLDRLKKALHSHPELDSTDPRYNTLLGLFNEFISDLGGPSKNSLSLSTNGFGIEKGIFAFLDKPIGDQTNGHNISHVQLRPSKGRKPGKNLFVVDPSIALQWKTPERNIVVYHGATLADIPFSGLGLERERIGNIDLIDEDKLLLLEDIFTEKLSIIMQENALPGGMMSPGSGSLRMQNRLVTPLLPINAILLDHLDNEEIKSNIIFEQSGESIHVRIRLMLSGLDGNGSFVEFKKEYKQDNIRVLEGVPVIEVWPKLITDGWKSYFTLFSRLVRRDTFYGKPYVIGCANESEVIKSEGNKNLVEITKTGSFPIAFICKALDPNQQLNRMNEQDAGLILLRAPEPISKGNDEWRIGVDFGTTSTSVYLVGSAGNKEALKFRKDLLLTVTASGDTARVELYDEFIPGEDEVTPFLSLYQEFKEQKRGDNLEPLTDGHIFFLDQSKAFLQIPGNVAKNLKWSDAELDRYRVEAFLEQVCLHAAAEAASRGVDKIHYRYSFPTAFSSAKTSGLPQQWAQIVEKCKEHTGIDMVTDKPLSESHAAAVYFAEVLNAPIGFGAICIDIGGGTSDVAIWQNNRICHQVSLRLAGRELFLNTLRANPEFLQRFGTDITHLISLKDSQIDFYAQADAIIKHKGKDWFKQLPIIGGKEDTKKFIQIIALGLSGLVFYIGLVLRHLITEDKYNKEEVPDIYIGGNGSNLFHWLSFGSYKVYDSHIYKLFRETFLQSSGLHDNPEHPFRIVLSGIPKGEAAQGLLGERTLGAPENTEEDIAVISGEGYLMGAENYPWDSLLTASMYTKKIDPPAKLEKMEDFLKIFNSYAAKRDSGIPSVTGTIAVDIRRQLEGKLARIRENDSKKITVEPVFILALKVLLELCTEEWRTL